ncbi:MAG: DUF2335 domain-containing protein [Breznakiellaceae bacterium]
MSNKRNVPFAQQQQHIVQQQSIYSGPLPPSSELAHYNDIIPGAAERILRMAEEEGNHRRKMEERLVEEQIRASKTGQRFAFILGIGSLTVVTVSITLNQPLASIVPAIIAIISLGVSLFKK